MTNTVRTALVLGATGGIGSETAHALSRRMEDSRTGTERTSGKLNRLMGVGEG